MKKITKWIRLNEDVVNWLEGQKEKKGTPLTWIIEQAINEYMKKRKNF